MAFGAFLLFALLVFFLTSICLDLVDSLLEVKVARLTSIVIRYLVVVLDLVVFALHILLVLANFVNYGIGLLTIYNWVFF